MVDLTEKKRDENELPREEIEYIVVNYTNGKIPDYQVNALSMAIFYQDMANEEITNLTLTIANSDSVIDLSSLEKIKVDKHSTGGVGDTTTLILVPLVASIRMTVTKISGYGLGYADGTLGKLEATPGFQIGLPGEEFVRTVNESRVAVTGQSGSLAPVGKGLYASRGATAAANPLPLITSPVINKKVATEADATILDVTTGDGAFIKNIGDARRLAKTMTSIRKLANRKTVVVISGMSEPLGEATGSNLEVAEAIGALQGNGPEDLVEMCCTLGSQAIIPASEAKTTDEVRALLQEALESGKALTRFEEMIQNQEGDLAIVEHPERISAARHAVELPAKQSGVVSKVVANELGVATMMLGTRRETKEEDIDHAVGLKLHKKAGDIMTKGESLLTIYSNGEKITPVIGLLYRSVEIGRSTMKPTLIHDIVTE